MPNGPCSRLDLSKTKPGPHDDGLIGSINSGAASLLTQLQQLSLQSSPSGQAVPAESSPSQSLSINVVQASDPKGNQQSDGKKKGRNNKKKDKNRKGNANKTNEHVGEGPKEKKKVKFPCKLCAGDHITHLCPKIQDAQCLLAQQGSSSSQAVLTNPFPPRATASCWRESKYWGFLWGHPGRGNSIEHLYDECSRGCRYEIP